MEMQYKNIANEIKDIDTKQGIVSGYFAAFDSLDSDGDIIVKGAYKKTLSEGFKRVRWLLNHKVTDPIGVLTELYEDNYGLKFVGQVTGSKERRDNLIDWYSTGTISEHSHGFKVMNEKKESGANYITEMKLWEGSGLTGWGANPNTPTTSVKSLFEAYDDYTLKNVLAYIKTIKDSKEQQELMTLFCIQQSQYAQEIKEVKTEDVVSDYKNVGISAALTTLGFKL